MDKQVVNSVISMVNGIECSLMRQTFLDLQEDENATNAQLVNDAQNWNKYLDFYCSIYRDIHRDIPVL
jgi:hypothetical protein